MCIRESFSSSFPRCCFQLLIAGSKGKSSWKDPLGFRSGWLKHTVRIISSLLKEKGLTFVWLGTGAVYCTTQIFFPFFKQKNSLSVYDRSRVFFQLKKKRNTILLRGKKGVQNVALPNYIGNGCKSHCITFPPTNLNKLPPFYFQEKIWLNFSLIIDSMIYPRLLMLCIPLKIGDGIDQSGPYRLWSYRRKEYTLLHLIAKGELFLQPIKKTCLNIGIGFLFSRKKVREGVGGGAAQFVHVA